MSESATITCPACETEIKLTESLAAPLIEATKSEYEKRMAEKDAAIRKEREELSKAQASVDEEVATKIKSERAKIVAEEAKKARLLVSTEIEEKRRELAELQEIIAQKNLKLTEAQKAQAELIRKQRELDDAKREMDLTVETRIQEGLDKVKEKARKEAEEGLKLKMMEKEQTIASMQRQIEQLKRKAEQGSQQLQGEVQELDLESTLRATFPEDTVEPVPKGEHGGDMLQRVVGPLRRHCGTIIWESKRTKNWSAGWLSKLRDDQRAAKADVAVIVSEALPNGVESFQFVDRVWVAHPQAIVPLTVVLREMLIEVASTRLASEGQQTKMGLVYEYLTGSQFRQRVEALVEAFSSMQEDLCKEKKAITKQWAKREKQIARALQGTAGMYGDLQGIAGKNLCELEGLDLLALEGFSDSDSRDQNGEGGDRDSRGGGQKPRPRSVASAQEASGR